MAKRRVVYYRPRPSEPVPEEFEPEEEEKRPMPKGDRQNTLTIGGVLLQRESGGFTIANPIAQYGNVRDDQVQMFWHWLDQNAAVQAAMAEFQAKVVAELMKWGDEMGLEDES